MEKNQSAYSSNTQKRTDKRDARYRKNPAKRLPMLIAIDNSPSMDNSVDDMDPENTRKMDLTNRALEVLIREVAKSAHSIAAIEICFVVFNENVELVTPFYNINDLTPDTFREYFKNHQDVKLKHMNVEGVKNGIYYPEFRDTQRDTGTNVGLAVSKSYEILEEHRAALTGAQIGSYVPYFVLITDGDPDAIDWYSIQDWREDPSVRTVVGKCRGHVDNVVIPFIIGVGTSISEHGRELLSCYAEGFLHGIFKIDSPENPGDLFAQVFTLISDSFTDSINLSRENFMKNMDDRIIKKIKSAKDYDTFFAMQV